MGMQGHERRHGHRFIMRVPLRFHATKEAALREESVSSMNISTHGVYFATDQKIDEGVLVQLHLKMPKEIVGDDVGEWSFTGRVAHVEPLSRQNGDRKSTRLNSSHGYISYAVFCLKKKNHRRGTPPIQIAYVPTPQYAVR